MLHLRKIILKISDKDLKEFTFWLGQNNAEKCAQLFSLMRDGTLEESEMGKELKISPSAFYALKSRLHGKIQEFFAHNVPDSGIDLLRNVANIPNLLYNTPREIAISHLLKMEKELIEHDMPYALTTVYSALKKISRYSHKYFDYAQRYNKHLAYMMAIDKAKELLSDFNKTLGEYLMSRDEKQLEVLDLIRQEMHNYAQLYDSHHLMAYKNILEAEHALFTPESQKNKREVAVDEILIKVEKIVTSYKNDAGYSFLKTLIDFLWFQYYHQQGHHKKASGHYALVNEKLHSFFLNNFFCFPTLFLISKVERSLQNKEEHKLYDESKHLYTSFTPDAEDVPNYINHVKFQAIAAYYSGKYNESISLLNELLRTVSFMNFPHTEVEVKLFLAVCYLSAHKFELADALIKNCQRKLRDFPENYENVRTAAKMLAVLMGPAGKKNGEKLTKFRDKFLMQNQKESKMLEYICWDDASLKSLSIQLNYN